MKQTATHLFFSKSYLSNWVASPYTIDGVLFSCVEQGMMYFKAKLFGDEKIAQKIMEEKRPWRQKQLGRLVKGYDHQVWVTNREEIVFNCCYAKFHQNAELGKKLLATDPLILVEASRVDEIWGVGLAEDDPAVLDPGNWTGLNLLGKALMRARDKLRYPPVFA